MCRGVELQRNVELLPPLWCTTKRVLNNDDNNRLTSVYAVIFLPLSVTKNLDIVSIAVPFWPFEKLCSSSSFMSRPLSLHTAFVLGPKPTSGGGALHVTVTLFPKNTSAGSNFKGVRSLNSKGHISHTKAYFLKPDAVLQQKHLDILTFKNHGIIFRHLIKYSLFCCNDFHVLNIGGFYNVVNNGAPGPATAE